MRLDISSASSGTLGSSVLAEPGAASTSAADARAVAEVIKDFKRMVTSSSQIYRHYKLSGQIVKRKVALHFPVMRKTVLTIIARG
jgi:hypothetical protein